MEITRERAEDMENINYEELIERAKKQDQEAITELYHLTYNLGFYIAQQICRNFDDALDVLQESYIKAFSSLNRLKDSDRFQAWLNQIIINKSKDYLRKLKRIKFADTEKEEIYNIKDDRIEFNPEEFVDYEQTKQILQEILDSLSDEQRLVTLMYYFEEMSISEMASLLKCKENTIKSRLFKARKKIKESILEFEKTGLKLYGALPATFFAWCLKKDAGAFSMSAEQANISLDIIISGVATMAALTGTVVGVTGTAAGITDTVAKGIFVRAATGLLIGTLAVGGSGLYLHKSIMGPIVFETQEETEQPTTTTEIYNNQEIADGKSKKIQETKVAETAKKEVVDYSLADISELLKEDLKAETDHLNINLPQLAIDTEGSRTFNREIQDIYTEYVNMQAIQQEDISYSIDYTAQKDGKIITILIKSNSTKWGDRAAGVGFDSGGETWAFNFSLEQDKMLQLSDAADAYGMSVSDINNYAVSYINSRKAEGYGVTEAQSDYQVNGSEMYYWKDSDTLVVVPDVQLLSIATSSANGRTMLLECQLNEPAQTVPEWFYNVSGTYKNDSFDYPFYILPVNSNTFGGVIRINNRCYYFDGTTSEGKLNSNIRYYFGQDEPVLGTISIDMTNVDDIKVTLQTAEISFENVSYHAVESIAYELFYPGEWVSEDQNIKVSIEHAGEASNGLTVTWLGQPIYFSGIIIDGILAGTADTWEDMNLYFNADGTINITLMSIDKELFFDKVPLVKLTE